MRVAIAAMSPTTRHLTMSEYLVDVPVRLKQYER